MRVRNFGSDGSGRFGSRLNNVRFSQSDSKKNDGDFVYYKKQIYQTLKESPKTIYDSVKKFEFVTVTNKVMDKLENVFTVANFQAIAPLICGFITILLIIWTLAHITSPSTSYDL